MFHFGFCLLSLPLNQIKNISKYGNSQKPSKKISRIKKAQIWITTVALVGVLDERQSVGDCFKIL